MEEEKQIGKVPLTTISTKMVKGKIIGYSIHHCSKCGNKVRKAYNYCSLCGQKIEWCDI